MKRYALRGVCCISAVAVGVFCLFTTFAIAQVKPEQVAEADLKVAYTISFFKFLKHDNPKSRHTHSAVVLCVVGDGRVADAFARAEGLELMLDSPRKLQVQRTSFRLEDKTLDNCWAVYVEHSNRNRIGAIAKQLRGKGILLICESKGALGKGAMLNLLRAGDKLRWEMSRSSLESERLGMSAQVYRNAVWVE